MAYVFLLVYSFLLIECSLSSEENTWTYRTKSLVSAISLADLVQIVLMLLNCNYFNPLSYSSNVGYFLSSSCSCTQEAYRELIRAATKLFEPFFFFFFSLFQVSSLIYIHTLLSTIFIKFWNLLLNLYRQLINRSFIILEDL